jgi:anti-sigma B factor antagonist
MVSGMTRPDFSITVSGSPEHPVVEVSGELDYRNGLALVEQVDALLADEPGRLSLELSGIGFCASGSVSALVAVHHAAERTRADLDLVNVPRNLHRLLELSGVLDLFNIQPSANPGGRRRPGRSARYETPSTHRQGGRRGRPSLRGAREFLRANTRQLNRRSHQTGSP